MAAKTEPPENPFDKGLPLLFRNNMTLGGLVTILALVFAANAYADLNGDHDPAPSEKPLVNVAQVKRRLCPRTERAAFCIAPRALTGTPPAAQVLPDGRLLMQDGSIVSRR